MSTSWTFFPSFSKGKGSDVSSINHVRKKLGLETGRGFGHPKGVVVEGGVQREVGVTVRRTLVLRDFGQDQSGDRYSFPGNLRTIFQEESLHSLKF